MTSKVAKLIIVEDPKWNDETQSKPKAISKIQNSEDGQNEKHSFLGGISAIERPKEIPMSTFQRRLWFLHNMNDDKSLLNFPVILNIKGQLDVQNLQMTMLEMTRRNESLRTAYFEGEKFAEQKPLHHINLHLEYQDYSFAKAPRANLEIYVSESRKRELEIENGEVFRASLIKLADKEYAIALIFHHIAIDRGSSKSFLSQLTSIYDDIRSGNDISSARLPSIQYPDFSIWHNLQLRSPDLAIDKEFWKEKLTGAPVASQLLPFAKSHRPPQMDRKRAIHKAVLGLQIFNRMKRICSHLGMTPFQFLLTAFRCFLYRYTKEKDLTILVIDGNRPHPDLDDVLGFFVNMIPLRCQNDFEGGFENLLQDIKHVTLEAMTHSRVPFDTIVDSIETVKSFSHLPLGQVALNYQMHGKMPHYPARDFTIHDVTSSDIPTACELQLEAMEDPSTGLSLKLEYSTLLYSDEDMDRFLDNFITFTTSAVKDHRQPISEIPMCGPKEIRHLRDTFWATSLTKNYWSNKPVLQLILETAKAHPHAVAVQTSDQDSITYEELVRKARSIAFALRREGALPGHYIGLLCQPSIEAIAGMIGILLTRCGYVPMDLDFAASRLAFMASDSNCQFILFGRGLEVPATNIAIKAGNSPRIIGIADAALETNRLGMLKSAAADDPFYVIYTSVCNSLHAFLNISGLIESFSREVRGLPRELCSLNPILSICSALFTMITISAFTISSSTILRSLSIFRSFRFSQH